MSSTDNSTTGTCVTRLNLCGDFAANQDARTSCSTLAVRQRQMYFVADVEGVDNVGMRETVGSLRAYFILSGIAGVFSALRINLLNADIIGAIVELITIAFSLAFVYVGFALSRL